MKLRKLFVILLALLVVFSFVACDGSGGGSDDNGGTNGDNGGNGGDNGGGNEDPAAVTWPVRYLTENSEVEGAYFYIDFKQDGTFTAGETDGSVLGTNQMGGGTYSGDDPHGDGTITMSGDFGETPLEEGNYIIVDGVLSLFGLNWERQ